MTTTTDTALAEGIYTVTFPVDDLDRPLGQLKAEAAELTRESADEHGLRRVSKVQIHVTRGASPLITTRVKVTWVGPQPVIKGYV
ncbi:MAG: hypothetical protein QJR09_12005 [Micrococcus sp.]|nr:hypothetical protein [Micrococcus sp.]